MLVTSFDPYLPLNRPKPFADGVWTVDGPEIRMDYGPFGLPFPTRMTVVRLKDGSLWVHSPIAPDTELLAAIDALGPVQYLIAPNTIHYWYMADWLARYPDAASYAVADLRTKAKRPFRIDNVLEQPARFVWEDEIEWLVVPGTVVSEAVFHVHEASVTILTDLIENFEPRRIRGRLLRWLIRLGRADGHTPLDMRLTYRLKGNQASNQIARMLAWKPEKAIVAHGALYERDAAAQLARAFRWAK